jgi:hypothetical protein
MDAEATDTSGIRSSHPTLKWTRESSNAHAEIVLGRTVSAGRHAGFPSLATVETEDPWRIEEAANRHCD